MNTASTLPLWLQYLQALAVPFVAAVGAWIALQQMRIARKKLDHDRYEKRLKVFEAAHQLLSEAVTTDAISSNAFKQFVSGSTEAPFHYHEDIVSYLKQLERLAGSLMVNQRAAKQESNADRRAKAAQQADSELLWLQNELQSGSLVNHFRPYLALDSKRWRD